MQAGKPRVTHPIYWPRGIRLYVYDEDMSLIEESRDRVYDLNDNLLQTESSRVVHLGVEVHSKRWPVWDAEALRWIENRIVWDLEFDGNKVELSRHTRAVGRPCTEEFVWRLDVQ